VSGLAAGLAPLWRAGRLDAGGRRLLLAAILLGAGALAFGIALLGTSGYLISRAAQRPEVLSLLVAIVAVRAFGLARAGLRYAERLVSHDLALRHVGAVRARLFGRLVPLVPSALGQRRGELLARFVDDAETLQDVHLRVAIPVAVSLLVSVAAAVVAWLILPAAALVVVATLLLATLAVPAVSALAAAGAARRQAGARASLTAELVETIDGAPELVMAGQAQARSASLDVADRELGALARRDALSAALATGLGAALVGAGLVATLVVGVGAVHDGTLRGVLLAALALLLLGAYEAVLPLPGAARRGQQCLTAARRLEEVTRREPPVRDPRVARSADPAGALALNGVTLVYDDGDTVIGDADLLMTPGCRVGLRGPSGSGKTSLAELLVRFRDPTSGSVTLGGTDLRELSQDDVRRAVTLCGQGAHLFNTTVRENLLVAGRERGDAELWRALDAVTLGEWVRGLDDGLATMVGQEGAEVSGGERQRLALARALLSDCRYLVLDEPTAHLDRELARRVMAGATELAGDRGLLVISHAREDLDGLDVHTLAGARLGRGGGSAVLAERPERGLERVVER
jgi:thiol reductant ABC exporter CydC subunit